MFFFLSKILGFMFMPLSWVFVLLAASFVWKRQAKRLRMASLAVLLLFGNSFLLHEVNLLWETPVVLDEAIGEHDIAVVLGGYAYFSPENNRITFRSSSDRFLQGLRLLETKKVKHLILSGGSGYVTMPDLKESLYVGQYLRDIQISEHDFTLESESRNTRENAEFTAAILQRMKLEKQRIVLITSAYHMPRAQACFEKQGISVIPFPADPTVGERIFTFDHLFLPSAEAFTSWNVIIHEWVGYISYLLMGYA